MTSLLKVPLPIAIVLAGCSDIGVTTISPPDAPRIALDPQEPTTLDRLEVLVLEMPAQQGTRLEYTWLRDGAPVQEIEGTVVPAAQTAKGELWEVVVTPWAGALEGTSARAQVEILNTPPTVDAVFDPARPTRGDDLVVVTETSDPDQDLVSLRFDWQRDGQATDHTGELLPAGTVRRGELWSVQVTPNDGETDGDPVLLEVEIRNSPPTVDEVVLGPDPARTLTPLRATVSGVQDIDDDPVELTYVFRVDGVAVQGGPSVDLEPRHYVKGQTVEVEVTPRDDLDDGPTLRSNAIVIANTPPSATGAMITPSEVYVLTEPTCRGIGFEDVDGDPEGFEYRWTIDGAEAGGGATLASGSFARGDELRCYATPFDGEDRGTEVASAPVVVLNTPPSIDSVALTPESPRVTDLIEVVISGAADPDGDAISFRYAWTVGGVAIGHTGPTLDGSMFRKGDRITVTVTPNDGFDDGSPVTSASILAINSAPVIDGVTLSPDPAYTIDPLTAGVTARDPDGDPITLSYAWYVDGTLQSETTSMLGSGSFIKHQEVYVSVTASDGDDDSDPFESGAIVILNSIPTAPEVEIDPPDPLEEEDLFCDILTPSTDDDGDALTYHFTWELNGEEYDGPTTTTVHDGDTIAWTETAADDLWRCIAYANDGDDDGPEGRSDEVLVRDWAGERRFTNCSQTGTSGPSDAQCRTAYGSTLLAGEVSVVDGMQEWTVPVTGTFRIWACGASGASATSGRNGGRGACVRGDFALTRGDRLFIVVGQNGTEEGQNGGGGGGTWVLRDLGHGRWSRSNELMLVAGGGGGTRASASQNGCDGRTTLDAGTGSGSSSSHGCGALGTTHRGHGGPLPSSSWGSSGGGWLSDGVGDGSWGSGGRGFANRLLGTAAVSCGSSTGGFGGGATGNGCWGGGGGGGYGGGQGGLIAGGGGSYNNGSSTTTSLNGTHAHGYVTIDLR